MENIYYQLSDPKEWYAILNQKLPSVIHENQITLDARMGDGQSTYLKVQEGLWAQQMDFKLNEDLELTRIPHQKNELFLVDFYLSNSQILHKSKDHSFTLGFENMNVLLTSATTESKTIVKAHEPVQIFNLLFTHKWLDENVLVDETEMCNFFECNSPIYISENLDYRFSDLIKSIDLRHSDRLTSISIILQILDYLFVKLKRRRLNAPPKSNIHHKDLEQLMKVRESIDANPITEVSLELLSEQAGMSLSKFKRLFKEVFGTSPYQYHLQNKMAKAMEILTKGTYTVSETGFILGYANLSQFSKAFKNQFGILPSQVEA